MKLVDVPTGAAVTWAEFWRSRFIPQDETTEHGVRLRNCAACGGPLWMVVLRARPLLLVLCDRCSTIVSALRLEPGGGA